MDYYFAVYECDEDGNELERLKNFNKKEDAINFCNKQENAHVVIMPPANFDEGNSDDLSEWKHSIPYDPFEVVYEHYSDNSTNKWERAYRKAEKEWDKTHYDEFEPKYLGWLVITYAQKLGMKPNKYGNISDYDAAYYLFDGNTDALDDLIKTGDIESVINKYFNKQKNNSIKSAFPGENPRDEYLKMMGRNMRENQATLTQGEFDDAMDNNGNFIRGFYKWDSDNHNWGCEVDVNLYLVVSYDTDGGGVFIRLIDTSSGKREVVTTRHIHFLDYDDVAKECIDIGEKMNEDFTEFFE